MEKGLIQMLGLQTVWAGIAEGVVRRNRKGRGVEPGVVALSARHLVRITDKVRKPSEGARVGKVCRGVCSIPGRMNDHLNLHWGEQPLSKPLGFRWRYQTKSRFQPA